MPKLLFALTGSIACAKACGALSRLVQAGVEVQPVATQAALRFVGTATLEGLARRPVFHDLWEEGRGLDHIGLARWADGMVVCPATADALNRMAAGLADDPLGCLWLAWELGVKPWWVAPAMNVQMWGHPTVQRSLETLRGMGVRVLAPAAGMQACGEVGPGRLLEPEEIVPVVLAGLR